MGEERVPVLVFEARHTLSHYYIPFAKLDWSFLFRILPVLVSPKVSPSKYTSFLPGRGVGQGDKMFKVAVLAFSHGATSAVREQLAGCPPSISVLAASVPVPPCPTSRSGERGWPAEAQPLQHGASCCIMAPLAGTQALACFLWSGEIVSTEQATSSPPDLLWPAGVSYLCSPKRSLRGFAGFGRKREFCWRHFFFFSLVPRWPLFILLLIYIMLLLLFPPLHVVSSDWAGQTAFLSWMARDWEHITGCPGLLPKRAQLVL